MKKSLIAIAALAFVGAAAAQSSVSLYGIADIYVGKTKGNDAAAGDGGVSGSRWGVKGSEDLGGGLKANFNFEQSVSLIDGTAAGFDRQANVGFSGGFGTVKLGRSGTALDDMFGAANSGFDSGLSASNVWLGTNANGKVYTGSANAQLYYATPEFSGFSGAVSTQLNGNVSTNVPAVKTSAFNVKYAGGPVYVGLGYENAANQKGTMLNGSYDLGMAKLLASYYNTKSSTTGVKANSYQIGADVPVTSAMTISVGYAASKVNGTGNTDSAFGVAAAYNLSKRTTVYAGVRAESRKTAVADGDMYAVGIKHSF